MSRNRPPWLYLSVLLATCAGEPVQDLNCEVDTDCAGAQVCIDKRCSHPDACEFVSCQADETCVDGHCWMIDCSLRNCPGLGEVCVDEACTPVSCIDVSCPPEQRCAAGRCYPVDCETQTCDGYGEVCIGEECTQRTCVDVTCPPEQACADGYCYPDACASVCTQGQVCVDQVCVDAVCANVVCADPLVCQDGWCVDPSCPGPCDDSNPCTDDVCSQGVCLHNANTAACDDRLFCNGEDHCSYGTCIHAGDPCEGGSECVDACDESRDTCLLPSGTPCSSDGNSCTEDECDGQGSCVHSELAEGASCGEEDWQCCEGACVDTGITADHCGACGVICDLIHVATHACTAGVCQLVSCDFGWEDCDGQDANGCEQNLSSTSHCGSCDTVCDADETCNGSTCRCSGGPSCTFGQYCYPGTPPGYADSGCYDLPTMDRDPGCSDMGVIHQSPDYFARSRIYARPNALAYKYGLHQSCLAEGAVVFELPGSPLSIPANGVYESVGYLDNPVACSPDHVDLGRWEQWVVVDGYESNHVFATFYNSSCNGSDYETCIEGSNYCPPDFHNGKQVRWCE